MSIHAYSQTMNNPKKKKKNLSLSVKLSLK